MNVCIDVGYEGDNALAACVGFHDFEDSLPAQESTIKISGVHPYVPGEFYERELPCIQALLKSLNFVPSTIVVDSHVRLSDDGLRLGLGGILFNELRQEVPVIGVAKSSFRGLNNTIEVLRGESERPLFVTALGMSDVEAARLIKRMHGQFRIPSLLKRADKLSRG